MLSSSYVAIKGTGGCRLIFGVFVDVSLDVTCLKFSSYDAEGGDFDMLCYECFPGRGLIFYYKVASVLWLWWFLVLERGSTESNIFTILLLMATLPLLITFGD